MNEIRRIMVAVDFSDISKHLVRYATALARKLDAEVHLVNVINQKDIEAIRQVAEAYSTISLLDQIEERREDRLAALLAIISELDLDPDTIGRHVRSGTPYEALTLALKDLDIDLVIMGTRGRGQFSGMLFGSTATRMLHKCPVPLLTLRNNL
ncbi:MAG: universal stress protein [Desulfosarcina sp.]|nr:universal stress protein [Desulfobacterales bacterium]